jgi:hypothetical protein
MKETWAIWLNSADGSENGQWCQWYNSPDITIFSSKESAERQVRTSAWHRWKPEPRRFS